MNFRMIQAVIRKINSIGGGSGITEYLLFIIPFIFFSELFTIPYSVLLDIHYSVSSLSSNFGCIDVAIPSTLYSRLDSPT